MAQNRISRTIYASAARTASPSASTLLNRFEKGVQVFIDVTATAATPSVVFRVQGKDGVSGKWYNLLESAAITAVGTTLLRVEPGATEAANTVAAANVPRVWRVTATHADADSITYSVGAALVI